MSLNLERKIAEERAKEKRALRPKKVRSCRCPAQSVSKVANLNLVRQESGCMRWETLSLRFLRIHRSTARCTSRLPPVLVRRHTTV